MMRVGSHLGSILFRHSRPARASLRQLSTIAESSKANGRYTRAWLGATCLVGCSLFALSYRNNQASLADEQQATQSGWQDWKNGVMTNYEGRIRDFSSPEKVFSVFASVSKDGHNYMTVDDFIRALIPVGHGQAADKAYKGKGKGKRARLPAAFKLADQDGDGLISFEEYLFFVTLLSIPEQSFKVAFRMLDVNEDGTIDQNEFVKMIGFLRAASPHAQQTRSQSSGVAKGWLSHYFGDGSKGLSLDAFTKFLQQLKSDVLRLEFNIYDTQEVGYISQRDFGLLLVSYAQQHRADYRQRAASLEGTPIKLFTFDQFEHFNLLIEHLEEVETAMNLFKLNGRPFKKQDLSNLSKIICGSNLNQQVIDTIMNIFDSNNDGTLDLEEFVSVLKRRKGRGMVEQRDTGFVRRVERILKCVREG